MKNFLLILMLLSSAISYSQNIYYTTDSKNRFTEEELMEKRSEMESKVEKALEKKCMSV